MARTAIKPFSGLAITEAASRNVVPLFCGAFGAVAAVAVPAFAPVLLPKAASGASFSLAGAGAAGVVVKDASVNGDYKEYRTHIPNDVPLNQNPYGEDAPVSVPSAIKSSSTQPTPTGGSGS